MNLIFICGPPASGKLTIAEELVKLTGYKLFHNHVTMDLARELYPGFDELRFKLVDRLRLDVFSYAAENGTDLIFTLVYSGDKEDDTFIADAITAVEAVQGKVLFVELTAPDETLLARVSNESRVRFHKLKDPQILLSQLEASQYSRPLPVPASLRIDTSTIDAHEAARRIMTHYGLQPQ